MFAVSEKKKKKRCASLVNYLIEETFSGITSSRYSARLNEFICFDNMEKFINIPAVVHVCTYFLIFYFILASCFCSSISKF